MGDIIVQTKAASALWTYGNPETEIGLVANFRVARHPVRIGSR